MVELLRTGGRVSSGVEGRVSAPYTHTEHGHTIRWRIGTDTSRETPLSMLLKFLYTSADVTVTGGVPVWRMPPFSF